MEKSYTRILNSLAVALGALLMPLVNLGPGSTSWGMHLLALIALAIVLAAMNMHWQEKWLLVAAAILAIIGSAGNWTLLPLAVAQVLLALLINTQDMQTPLRATSMIAKSAFLQVLITMAGSQIITRTFLFQLLFTTVPFIIAAWGSELPLPLTAILVVGVGVAGYFTQTLTLLVTLLIIIWALLPVRVYSRMPAWYWTGAVPIIGFLLHLTILHG